MIDDDTRLTAIYSELLTLEGFEVSVANLGVKGIELARQFQPDVIMLDLMMPGMTGWEVCRKIRTFSDVPILMISAVVDSDGVMQALEEGANDYLVKPVPGGVLVSRLKRLARQARINLENRSEDTP